MLQIIFIILVLIPPLASGCAKQEDRSVLAKIGNRVITLAEFNDRIKKIPSYYRTIVSRNKKKFLDDLIVEELFYEEAVRESLHRDKETRDVIKEANKKILIARLIKKEVEDKITVDDAALRDYYESHKDEFVAPEMMRASHILLATQREAEDTLKGIKSGELNFEEAAKSRSLDATAKRGGDVGFFTRGQLVPEFEEACLRLNMEDQPQVVKTQFGYHVIKLTARRPPRIEDFNKVKGSIEERLKKDKRRELFNKLVSTLKERYKVKIEDEVYGTLREEPQEATEERRE